MNTEENQHRARSERSSDELKHAEAKLRRIIDTIPVIAWCGLPDGSAEFWNRRWRDYTGICLEDATDCGCRAAIHPKDWEKFEKKWNSDLASGKAGELDARLRRFDGEYRWFLFRYEPLRDQFGKIVNWYGTNTDIDDLKRAEQRLRQDEEEFRRITDAIPQGIVVLSPDGTAVYANRVALKETGLTSEEVQAQGFFLSAFHPEDVENLKASRDAGLLRGEPFELEIRGLRPNGEYQWRLIQYNPMRVDHAHITHWYATGTNIQNQKNEEERLRHGHAAYREHCGRLRLRAEIVGCSDPMRKVL